MKTLTITRIKKFFPILALMCSFIISGCTGSNNSGRGNISGEGNTMSECEHDYEVTFVEPTRYDKGYYLHRCKKCGDEFRDGYTGLFTEEEEQEGLSFLFIGNSYTFFVSNNEPPYLNSTFMNFKKIAELEGFELSVDNVTTGGYSLMQHADPTNDDGSLLRQKLDNNGYDLAFIQEQSLMPVRKPAMFYEGVRRVHALLEEQGIRACMYETWGRKKESADLERYGLTNETMTQILMGNYAAIAEELGIPVSHVGQAFYDVYTNYGEFIDLYNADNYHPSLVGSYLIAYVHYATVYGRSPIGMKVFNYDLEDILTEAAHNAVFGPSILKNEYKTSSVGVGLEVAEEDLTIELDAEVPSEFIKTGYNKGVGDWKITKDENGIATFESKAGKDSLIFKEQLFSGSGTLSFNLKVDGNFTGGSVQGIVFGSNIDQISWTTSNDTFYTCGRDKEGHVGLTTIYKGGVGNDDGVNPVEDVMMPDVSKTYNIKLVIDRTNWTVKSYVDGKFGGILLMGDRMEGPYIGLSSGLNGKATISNIQVNGKGLDVEIDDSGEPDPIDDYDYQDFENDVDVNPTHGTVKKALNEQGHKVFQCTGENATFVLKKIQLTNNMEIEFDAKFGGFTGACVQGVALGCDSVDYNAYKIGASAQIGRLKSGKVGGVVIENDTEKTKATQIGWSYCQQSSAGSGAALNAMADETSTYHIKIVYRYISEKKLEADLYVNNVFARGLSYTAASHNFGNYIAFTNGKDGEAIFSNITIGGNTL